MTILLPQDPSLFRQAFEETCNRIFQSNPDEVFYVLLVQLIPKLREHPFFKETVSQIETESSKRQKEFSDASLKVHEYNWKKLWQYHQGNSYHRRELARISRLVTFPTAISSSILHDRMGAAMWEFRYHSPFFRFMVEAPLLFRKARSDMQLSLTLRDYYSTCKEKVAVQRWINLLKLNKRDKRVKLQLKIRNSKKQEKPLQFKWRAEKISSLFSPLSAEIGRRFGFPGKNGDEKHRNMRVKAEIDLSSCWERLQFLEMCYNAPSDFPPPKRFLGEWESIRDNAWNAAWERCEKEALQWAQMSFRQKISATPNSSLDTFLSSERQIHRRDYESYLKSLQKHIHAQLFMINSCKNKEEDNSHLFSEGTQKENFVIQLTGGYWKDHTLANYDEAYSDYLIKCPQRKILSRSSWERIVRKRKLDPRPIGTKKRRKAKKTLQN